MIPFNNNLIEAVEQHVTKYIPEHVREEYIYHNLDHTKEVVEASWLIGKGYGLSDDELEVLIIAAWFHDTGYDKGQEDHEIRSSEYAQEFLRQHEYPTDKTEQVIRCIKATKVPQDPQSLLEEIICDADLSHLGSEYYWDRCGKLRQELAMTKNILMSEQEWVDFELDFIANHSYHTDVAVDTYEKNKERHLRQLRKQKFRLNPKLAELITDPVLLGEKKKKKKKKKKKGDDSELKQLNLGRGVETMYRTTYRTHVNLSSIADNKANIMLSINAIIISIVVANLVPQFNENRLLIIPTFILLGVCLTALVFAILSTRPKITEGKFTRQDIEQKRSNLLFFGNFYNMDIDDFHWGIMEMIKDSDFLYSSMTRDLYYLGVVLAAKYRYLRICYGVFMYGLIASVVVFAIFFLFPNELGGLFQDLPQDNLFLE